jgi:hypothetical protein
MPKHCNDFGDGKVKAGFDMLASRITESSITEALGLG